MYPELMVIPMREELTRLGIKELRDAAAVDRAITEQPGTTMVVVNSICGCAAGRMRPAVRLALQNSTKPDQLASVFAGQDAGATDRARSYFTGYPPSSPSIAILRDGKLVYMMQRRDIETRDAHSIAADLVAAPLAHADQIVPILRGDLTNRCREERRCVVDQRVELADGHGGHACLNDFANVNAANQYHTIDRCTDDQLIHLRIDHIEVCLGLPDRRLIFLQGCFRLFKRFCSKCNSRRLVTRL